MLRCHFPQIFPNEELPHLWLFVDIFIFLLLVVPLMTTTSTSGCSQLQVAKLCVGSERGRHRKRTERESQEIARKPGIRRKPQAQLDPKPWASYQGSHLLHLTSFIFSKSLYLLIFGWTGSSLLYGPFSSSSEWGLLSSWQRTSFSLRRLLLLPSTSV